VQPSSPDSARPLHNQRGRATREEILRVALRLIGERGIHTVTHRAVAEAAGVPVGAPSYYFGTIDGLLEEALLLFVREEVARMDALARHVVALKGATDEVVAEAFSQAIADTHVGQPTLVLAQYQLYLEAPRRPAVRKAATECLEAYRQLAVAALRTAGRASAETTADRFVALCDGFGLQQVANPRPDWGEAVLKPALLDLLRCVR
jgi:DNA-binding transcriptional regulator YbjK